VWPDSSSGSPFILLKKLKVLDELLASELGCIKKEGRLSFGAVSETV